MEDLLAAWAARLTGDATLAALVQGVYQGRPPQDPKLVSKPMVTFRLADGPDVAGLHGLALDVTVEVKVHGYSENPGAQYHECLAVMDRISLLFLRRLVTANGSYTARPAEAAGWQDVEEPDTQVVHLHNTFTMRYISVGRATELAS